MARTQDHPGRHRERTQLDDLADAVAAADKVLPELRRLLAVRRSIAAGVPGRSVPESDEPWNQEAAAVYWDIWYGARGLAQLMRHERGLADDCQTGPEALAQVLASAPHVSTRLLVRVTTRLWSWVRRAETLPDIGEAEPWTHLVHPPGLAPPACPYCKTFGLRTQVRAGVVACFYPDCRDLDDNPTRARMQPGWSGAPALYFGDGTVLAFANEMQEEQ